MQRVMYLVHALLVSSPPGVTMELLGALQRWIGPGASGRGKEEAAVRAGGTQWTYLPPPAPQGSFRLTDLIWPQEEIGFDDFHKWKKVQNTFYVIYFATPPPANLPHPSPISRLF